MAAKTSAQQGDDVTKRMSEAIAKIKESSDQTAKIIRRSMRSRSRPTLGSQRSSRGGARGRGRQGLRGRSRGGPQPRATQCRGRQDHREHDRGFAEERRGRRSRSPARWSDPRRDSGRITPRSGELVAEIAAASANRPRASSRSTPPYAQKSKVTRRTRPTPRMSGQRCRGAELSAEELPDGLDVRAHPRERQRAFQAQGRRGARVSRSMRRWPPGRPPRRERTCAEFDSGRALRQRQRFDAQGSPTKKAAAVAATPEEVIPLEDDELLDF